MLSGENKVDKNDEVRSKVFFTEIWGKQKILFVFYLIIIKWDVCFKELEVVEQKVAWGKNAVVLTYFVGWGLVVVRGKYLLLEKAL